jgi:hypothetical protein
VNWASTRFSQELLVGVQAHSTSPAAAQSPTRVSFFVVRRGGEAVEHDRDTDLGRTEAAQVAAELQEPRAVLPRLDVAVELVLAQVQGGEQVALCPRHP